MSPDVAGASDPAAAEGARTLPLAAAGRADLFRALDRDGESGLAAMARLLGYEARPVRRDAEPATAGEPRPPAREAPVEVEHAGFQPVPFWRPVLAELGSEEELARQLAPPAAEREVAMPTAADFEAGGASGRRVPAPIVAWPRVWRVLDDRLRTAMPRSEIDVGELVDRWARGENVERLPRLAGLVHSRVVVLLDRSPPLLPFRLDQLSLAGELVRRLGPASVRLTTVRGGESPAVAEDERVLALSDLGSYGGGKRAGYWRRLGERLRRSGVRTLALVPCPPARWPRRTADLWSALEWSGPDRRPSPRPDAAAARRDAEAFETLLRLASPAIRLETGLVRDLRRLIPGAGVDAEVELFRHPAVASRSARGLSLDRDEARRLFDGFVEQPEAVQRAAIGAMAAWHRGLAPEIWAEEVVGLLAHGVPEDWLEAGAAEAALELFERLCLLVERGDRDGSDLLQEAEAYFERFKGRASRPVWTHPRLRRPLARAVTALRERGEEEEAPAGATPEMFIPSSEEAETWAIWHQGAVLEVRRAGDAGEGSRLASFSVRGRQIKVVDGIGSELVFELGGEPPSFAVPRGGRPIEVVSDVETVRLELWQPPEWTSAAGRDEHGLWASFEVGGVTQILRWIPPGRFRMGSPDSEAGRWAEEGPRHWVLLTEGFWLADTPCTQELWEAVMGENPSRFKEGSQRPVEQVSWDDCQAFIDRLSFTVRGLEVRLPTEAEWEYACRAGTETPYWNGGDEASLKRIAWYGSNSEGRTHAVGQKPPNPWGLHDMLGNVYEWCWDWLGSYEPEIAVDPEGAREGALRVLRGGSWRAPARYVRAAFRYWDPPGARDPDLGFRLSRGRGPEPGLAEREVGGSARAGRGTSPRRRSRRELAWVERLGWAADGGADRFGRWASFEIDGVSHRMRWIVPGRFWMGSPESEIGRYDDEGPRHEVTLTRGFWLGETPCTQELWQAVMGENPSHFQAPRRPVEQVSWEDCQRFFERMNMRLPELAAGLPTEAQWEYACRAGTAAATWLGDLEILGERNAPRLDAIAWYSGNSGVGYDLETARDSSEWKETQYPHTKAGTRNVGLKVPNPWGLYDMLGNVYEWCSDFWDLGQRSPGGPRTDPEGPRAGAVRVIRGGSWFVRARYVRAAYRGGDRPGERGPYLGFRLSRGP